jgi:hypothetical protein
MNEDLIELYWQLEDATQTKEILKMKKRVRQKLEKNLEKHYSEYMNLGEVIGFSKLKDKLLTAIELIELQEKQSAIIKNKKPVK